MPCWERMVLFTHAHRILVDPFYQAARFVLTCLSIKGRQSLSSNQESC